MNKEFSFCDGSTLHLAILKSIQPTLYKEPPLNEVLGELHFVLFSLL